MSGGGPTSDVLYTAEFENLLSDFYRITNEEVTLPIISLYIQKLKESTILHVLMSDPTNADALMCLKNHIEKRNVAPYDFIGRFLSLCSSRISLLPNRVSTTNQSFMVKVQPNYVRPITKITNLTMKARVKQILEESQTRGRHVAHTKTPGSHKFKPIIETKDINSCINAMSDLHKCIMEGNRANGLQLDPYILSQIKYSS